MTMKQYLFIYILLLLTSFDTQLNGSDNSVQSRIQIARIQYSGGSDWYNDVSSIPNLCQFIRMHTNIDMALDEAIVSLNEERLFSYPILFITGHGRISVTEHEADQLRKYLEKGGFLYADDDYGMDSHFRRMMDRVFPDNEWIELPFDHEIYHQHFHFHSGLPKIHEHDNKPPQGFGLFDNNGRLMVFYTVETNLADGWADADVHHVPQIKREQALRMGLNIVVWALLN